MSVVARIERRSAAAIVAMPSVGFASPKGRAFFEKFLIRVGPPSKLFEYLESLSYEVCFCRNSDLDGQAGMQPVTLQRGLPGHGLPLIPVRGRRIPAMTDLIAVPKENIVVFG